MAMEPSILNSVKKVLGLDAGYEAFDQDVLMHINSSFFTLQQLGVGPAEGFVVDDANAIWVDFVGAGVTATALNAVKTYIYLKVRLLFDPPGTPHHIKAIQDQITELEHRLLTERELTWWTAPQSSSPYLP